MKLKSQITVVYLREQSTTEFTVSLPVNWICSVQINLFYNQNIQDIWDWTDSFLCGIYLHLYFHSTFFMEQSIENLTWKFGHD